MTNLYFRYSPIYEQALYGLSGEKLSDQMQEEGHRFAEKYIEYWQRYNDEIFAYYENLSIKMPSFWMAYFVHPQKDLIPFSDPLTLLVQDDLDTITATLIHELCHVMMSYSENEILYKKLWNHVQTIYPENDFNTNIHLIVNLLARAGLIKIFGEAKAERLLRLEKNYRGLKDAWKIIDRQPEILDETNPIQAILSLK